MKNIFLAFFILIVGEQVLANTVGFRCIPSMKETRLQILQESTKSDQGVVVRITNPMGFSMMPLLEGPVSQFQIPFLKMQAEDLQVLGDVFEIYWKKDQCQQLDWAKMRISCQGQGQLRLPVNSAKVTPMLMSSFSILEQAIDTETNFLKYRFVLEAAGNYYFVTLVYPAKSCASF